MIAFRPLSAACLLAASLGSIACATHSSDDPALSAPLRLSITVPAVPAGVEGTKCIRTYLGNDQPLKVGKIHNVLSASSHHFILSTVDDATLTDAPLFDCQPFRAALSGAPLTITQKSDDTVLLPDGVAYTLAPNQLMHLELHYINLSTETRDIEAKAELFPIEDTGKPLQEASFLLIGDLDISIPPNSKHSTGPVYQPLPDAFAGVNFYALTGHTHRFGTDVRVGTAESATASVTSLYAPTDFNWAEPELLRLNPMAHVPAGGGFSYQCDWDNTTGDTVTYGESALDEMCFFWAYYYPKKDASRLLLTGANQASGSDAGVTLNGSPCAAVGDKGNSLGVGQYCTTGGSECSGSAAVCLADYTQGAFGDFCTKLCTTAADCAEGAACEGTTTAICVPNACLGDAAAP